MDFVLLYVFKFIDLSWFGDNCYISPEHWFACFNCILHHLIYHEKDFSQGLHATAEDSPFLFIKLCGVKVIQMLKMVMGFVQP
ncbi:hypothetical protein ASG85_36330 [Paenibacillus sp. Soil724D2]|nr:hypothetical protein ASG85_36330 [Paenibacillus sp. Soil724D2]